MATLEMITTLLREASGMTVRTYTEADVEDAAGAFNRKWRDIPDADLVAAFDAWMDSQNQKSPQALPTPNQVFGFHRKTKERTTVTSSEIRQRATPEQVAAQLQIRNALNDVLGVGPEKHRHGQTVIDDKTGESKVITAEECTACVAQAKRRQAMADAAANLPTPSYEGAATRCKCDGGWVETKASLSRRAVEGGGAADLYPCPECRFDQFMEWKSDGEGAAA